MIDIDYLWDKQAKLNKEAGIDTLGNFYSLTKLFDKFNNELDEATTAFKQLFIESFYDYLLALLSELNELKDCVIWKHWCKEAKDGKRWEIADPQNASVEVIDILFFLISLAQISGLSPNLILELNKTPDEVEEFKIVPGRWLVGFVTEASVVLGTAFHEIEPVNIRKYVKTQFYYWFLYTNILGLSDEQIMDLYNKKWEVNMNRLQRGRLQIGDKLADDENAAIVTSNENEK